ncbi:MAG: TauD/TfdA family dioxygenase [Alphaproteobacteria bacterium]|nr:TauD/TfdA family dioxygenase [Alphaproteobacteria bacterium]
MKLEKPDPRIGAIATDVDVRSLSDADWNHLYAAWLEGIVLVVRGQTLSMEEFLAYSRRFGRLKPHRVRRTRHAQHPELTVMGVGTRKPDGSVDRAIYNRGGGWHTDSPWDTEICKGTQLYALAIPSYGGDTLFASMYEAYDALPDGLKARIDGLNAEHVYGGRARKGNDLLEPEDRDLPPAVHPVVRVHEETGRKSLYANPTHILRIQGLGDSESDRLVAELTEHMVNTPAQYRHKWSAGDIVIWDNRCALHAATGGYPIEEPRIHWRVTIMQ